MPRPSDKPSLSIPMPAHSSTPEPQALPLRAAAHPPRLLIVEDEADLSALLQLHLSELPAEVSIAADGELGLSLALTEPWDLIVLDLRLPRLGGLDPTHACSTGVLGPKITPVVE